MRVGTRALAREELILLTSLKSGFVDFSHLVGEEIEFPREGLGIFREALFFSGEMHPIAAPSGIIRSQRLRPRKGVQNQHLLIS